ncbi:putative transcriptional regulator ycf27 [Actinoplanes sp. SE50]|uniref:response regulator n=1 Tax=unclassified Actinoplanes TaxID=2626549 RepID=UPI00023ECB12|nr:MULTISPECIES: response regulator [unclassified Actinoplanes]AEV84274.1 putative transcriptional regulator ycf27 [Actinoplanes sp. SE50/110]ATO82666.1 putative transcriptional regulator ycf27 [Actinoplanes sp. SE50]SLM00073.1 response regulator receiver domain protein [Actinoplanes sp. SE50/110]
MSHIVAADDDAGIRRVVERVLTRAGHTVDLCSNGQELVTEVRAQHPDAVVTDNEMPGMTGLQARAELLTTPDTEDIPVVMASGSVTPEQAAATLREGDRVVHKPFQPAELRDAVREVLIHRRPRPA